MNVVLVTGAAGFIGRNVVESLRRRPNTRVIENDIDSKANCLESSLRECDTIIHLAGVNRPKDVAEYSRGNTDLTTALCEALIAQQRSPTLVMSSSIQAALDNAYGTSKRRAEEAVERWSRAGHGRGIVFRLKNVFGKWCRPNYNSVVATFCYNIARGLPITISEPSREIDLVYIDDVVAALTACVGHDAKPGFERREISTSYKVTLGYLAALIHGFRNSRRTHTLPSFADDFTRKLYSTYLSYLEISDLGYPLEQRADCRGKLAEFLKSENFGQIFVSRTKPGVTRGNHYHHSKTEKFLVVEGDAIVRFRHIGGGPVLEYRVNGREFRVLDIPPGYTHSIENIGLVELVTIFWASEIFDPSRPDTYIMPVFGEAENSVSREIKASSLRGRFS